MPMTVEEARAHIARNAAVGATSGAPPKDVNGSDLWLRLTETPRPSTLFEFPGKGPDGQPLGKVAIQILTETEEQRCRANAEREARAILRGDKKGGEQYVEPSSGSLGYEDVYRNELIVQLVCEACRAPENKKVPAFPSPEKARAWLTGDQFAVLAEAYMNHRREAGPILSELTVDEMEGWITVLQEGGSRLPLASLSGEAQSDLILYLVSKLASLSTVTSSAGSPPSEASTDGSGSAT